MALTPPAPASTAPTVQANLETRLGRIGVVVTPRGLSRVDLLGGEPASSHRRRRRPPLPEGASSVLEQATAQIEEYLEGGRRDFTVPLDLDGVAEFGRRVLVAAAAIPYGETRTYTEIAEAAGSPRGARAAGNALGANPLPIVIPCHRVVRTGGGLGGYTGGLPVKRRLLDLEVGTVGSTA